MNAIHIPNLSHPPYWLHQPEHWGLSPNGQLTITAPAKTDWFIDPGGTVDVSNAPALLVPTPDLCMLSAQVSVHHLATFDAGVLLVYENPLAWAKLCLEFLRRDVP